MTATKKRINERARRDRSSGQVVLRRCVGSGERREEQYLVRLVVDADGCVVTDFSRRLPGRGIWLLPVPEMLVHRQLVKRLAYAARRGVSIAPDFAERLEIGLAARCVEAIGLARRAGHAVAGAVRVAKFCASRPGGMICCSFDAGSTARQRAEALAKGRILSTALSGRELGRAFGCERMVHAAVAQGPLCERMRLECNRLAILRGQMKLPPPPEHDERCSGGGLQPLKDGYDQG